MTSVPSSDPNDDDVIDAADHLHWDDPAVESLSKGMEQLEMKVSSDSAGNPYSDLIDILGKRAWFVIFSMKRLELVRRAAS